MALPNYVKFQRGTISAYEKIKASNSLDNDTLYFIYENKDSAQGSLYLGNKLIGGVSNSGSNPTSLSDLTDIILEGAQVGDFLVKGSDGKWVNATPEEVANLILDTGNSIVNIDENQFNFIEVNGVNSLSLLGFDSAAEGSMLSKVDGKVAWSAPADVSTLTQRVETLEEALSEANNLSWTKAESIADIQKDIEDGNTANKIYLVPAVGSLDAQNQFTEFMVVDGKIETLGSVGINLSDYATVENLEAVDTRLQAVESSLQAVGTTYLTVSRYESEVGTFSDLKLSGDNETLIDEINDINERLTWSELSE